MPQKTTRIDVGKRITRRIADTSLDVKASIDGSYILITCSRFANLLLMAIPWRSPYGDGKKMTGPSEETMMTQEQDVPSVPEVDLSHAVRSDACVLFTGDHEVAELLARRLHRLSGWRQGPFISVDCALPETVLESCLFDVLEVEKAGADHGPWATPAQSGTVFLRDIGRLPRAVQGRLSERLAILRTKPGEPKRTRRRVISWSPIPLSARIEDGSFDANLYYRLNVIHLVISPDNRQ
jgi:DNA-binding NtrC family response regulator